MKNITLSIDEDLLKKGREYAQAHRTSLNALIRSLLRRVVSTQTDHWCEECFAKMDKAGGHSGGKRWTRDDLYDA